MFTILPINRWKTLYSGRGRGRPTVAKEFEAPGGLKDYAESETASCISQQSEISDISQRDSAATPSEEVCPKKILSNALLFLNFLQYSNFEWKKLVVVIHLK